MSLVTRYDEIVDVSKIGVFDPTRHSGNILPLAAREKLPPANGDGRRVLLVGIDLQYDFVSPTGSLSVPGSVDDIARLTQWIYDNMAKISTIMLSIDTHDVNQIFHPSFWEDQNGNQAQPYTLITIDDVDAGTWRPVVGSPSKVSDCLKTLKERGKGGVFVWPYHCLRGTPGWSLEQELMNMVHFHAAARTTKPITITKGWDTYSEMYGILEPEYNPNNRVQADILSVIASVNNGVVSGSQYDEIYLAGEAASHCLLESGRQILSRLANYPDVTKRITILEDCTSPVTGYEQQVIDGFDELRKTYGIQIRKSTDCVL